MFEASASNQSWWTCRSVASRVLCSLFGDGQFKFCIAEILLDSTQPKETVADAESVVILLDLTLWG